jgi:hypothetical protein
MTATRSRCHLTVARAETMEYLAHTWAYDAEELREQARLVRKTYSNIKLCLILRLPNGSTEEL